MAESLVITIPEACELLDISRTAGYEAARRGDLPTIRIGRSVRVPRAALERMLAAAEPHNTAEEIKKT